MSKKTAILSDIHGNSTALRAVLEDISRHDCSLIYILGDIINGIDPKTCVYLIQEIKLSVCLKGNAEFYVLTPDLEEFPHQNDQLYCELIPLLKWFISNLSNEDMQWLRGLPVMIMQNGDCFVHDSPVDRLSAQSNAIPGIPEKYQELTFHAKGITPDMPIAEWERILSWMEKESVSQLFCGHTHVPLIRKTGGKLICNVGSVGMPLDGDPRASWVLLETKAGEENKITIRRVPYDLKQALTMVDDVPDYPDFLIPSRREAYKKILATGRFWK
jgi:predicted phosphodiesterase